MQRLTPLYPTICTTKTSKTSVIHMNIQSCSQQCSLLWDFQEISNGIFRSNFHDQPNQLTCTMTLELLECFVPDSASAAGGIFELSLSSDFPSIDIQRLCQIVSWDEYLYAMLLIQFQLNILEQLLLFCEKVNATHLILNLNETNQDYLEIYERFVCSQAKRVSPRGSYVSICIPTDANTYDALLDFMDDIQIKFKQTLWQEQKHKPIYRQFIKTQALL